MQWEIEATCAGTVGDGDRVERGRLRMGCKFTEWMEIGINYRPHAALYCRLAFVLCHGIFVSAEFWKFDNSG